MPVTIDEAAFDLDMSGHDFYLFTESETGADAVLFFRDDGRLGLQLPEGVTVGVGPGAGAADVEVAPPAPTLSTREAIERLESGGERFVFFVHPDSDRGTIVYHRYDGHWGVLSAA
jgi:hypothetical protein